jgi:hypothetical protein
MKAAVREAFESGAHPAQRSGSQSADQESSVPKGK